MEDLISNILFTASVWALPVLIAITLHEAAHGYVANKLGDPTARLMGRVTLNPISHIDRFGTIILPMLCLISSWAFNMLPIPPLDGGRIVTGLLPYNLAARYSRLEQYGLFIVIGLMFLLPFIGREIGVDLGFALDFVMFGVKYLLHFILMLTGQF